MEWSRRKLKPEPKPSSTNSISKNDYYYKDALMFFNTTWIQCQRNVKHDPENINLSKLIIKKYNSGNVLFFNLRLKAEDSSV